MLTGLQKIMRGRFLLFSVLAAAFSLLVFFQVSRAAEGGGAPHLMQRGAFRLPGGAEIGDLVISGGPVEIMGVVRGSVFVVDGQVSVFGGGEVFGNVTVIDDDLRLLAGSTVHGAVFVIGGNIEREDGARVEGEIDQKREELSYESLRLLRDYLVFERPIPPFDSPDEFLEALIDGHRGWRGGTIAAWNGLAVEGLPAVALPASVSSSARIGLWRSRDWEIVVGVARFAGEEDAASFWEDVHGKWAGERISRSVHVSLGDGAHWFFRHGERSALLWVRDKYLIMLDIGPVPGEKGSAHYAEHLRDEVIEWIEDTWTK